MINWYKKVMTWGKGMSKLAKKVLTYVMDDSMVLENADNNNTIFAVKLAKTQQTQCFVKLRKSDMRFIRIGTDSCNPLFRTLYVHGTYFVPYISP